MLSTKEKALVGLGAAIAAGCQPCTRSYIRAARAAGACERGIRIAVESGLALRAKATEAMALWAAAEQGQTPVVDDAFRVEKAKIVALVAAAAAYADNSTATLEVQIDNAREHHWTDGQIAEALGIGSSVARTATTKVAGAAARRGLLVNGAEDSCCGDQRTSAAHPPAAPGNCGCANAESNT